jgi:hypothetical protein
VNSSLLGQLYHWSPSTRRVDILREGLQVYSEACTHADGLLRWPYICLSPHPSQAWALSVDAANSNNDNDPIEEWDLWQVTVPDGAEVHVQPFWGRRIQEIKVYTSIPADHIFFCGERSDKMVAIGNDNKPYTAPKEKKMAKKKLPAALKANQFKKGAAKKAAPKKKATKKKG